MEHTMDPRQVVALAHTITALDEDAMLEHLEVSLVADLIPLIVNDTHYAFPASEAPRAADIVGICHPPSAFCNICVGAELSSDDPETTTEGRLYHCLANYHPHSLSVLRDCCTWLSMYSEWAHQEYTRDYFRRQYPILRNAMDVINRKTPEELHDVSGLSIRNRRVQGLKLGAEPVYCSWSMLPSDTASIDSVFYLPTRMKLRTDVIDYLNVTFNLPSDIANAFLDIVYTSEGRGPRSDKVTAMVKAHHTGKMQRSRSGDRLNQNPSRRGDERASRNSRLRRIPELQRLFDASEPRLHIFCDESLAEEGLRPRDDYVFVPHQYYSNVFRVSLDATSARSEADEDDLESGRPW